MSDGISIALLKDQIERNIRDNHTYKLNNGFPIKYQKYEERLACRVRFGSMTIKSGLGSLFLQFDGENEWEIGEGVLESLLGGLSERHVDIV